MCGERAGGGDRKELRLGGVGAAGEDDRGLRAENDAGGLIL